jgi:arylformamidase
MAEAVFRDYDQQRLNAEYNNRAKVANADDYKAAQSVTSDRVRATANGRLDVAYGDAPDERLDIFPASGDGPHPVHVFFHGGYWKSNRKEDFAFAANPFIGFGATVVVAEYALIPGVTMAELIRQCRAALAWVWRNAGSFGSDPGRISVSGHSAGGHITAMMMATDWPVFEKGLPADLVKAGIGISGLYDLVPVQLSSQNDDLGLTADEALEFSPVLMTPPGGGRLLLPVGGDEGPEFIRQADDLAAAWSAKGVEARSWILPGDNHFSIVNQYIDPNSVLSRAARALIGLG